MAKPKLIIIEGAPGSGKSTITRMLREKMKNTMLVSESSIPVASPFMSYLYHSNVYSMINDMHNTQSNFILDRSHITQQVYCKLGHVDFPFDEEFETLNAKLDMLTAYYDVYVVLLCADKNEFASRLERDKAQYIKHSVEESKRQQLTYMKILDSMETKAKKIVFNNTGLKPEQTYSLLMANFQ